MCNREMDWTGLSCCCWREGNGFAISDRTGIPNARFANIWGVSNEDLFAHAVDYFDARAKAAQPFFSIIMTTSNHKPFTFPAAGARYADYAIGLFIDAALRRD